MPKRSRVVIRGDIYLQAQILINAVKASSFEELDTIIEDKKSRQTDSDLVGWLVLLVLQAPRAAHAQSMMDEYPRGYHDRKARLYELIDFNDTFVSVVLLLPDEELAAFTNHARSMMGAFSRRMHSRTFDNEQYGAIVHGLSREIAVFKAVRNAGLEAVMTSRTADAFGIDMQIRDSNTGRYVNIDCKTSSSFHFRLKSLVREHRIAPRDIVDAEAKGWWEIVNRNQDQRVKLILLRVSQDELGRIRAFRFDSEQAIVERIKQILTQRSLNDNRYGKL